MIQRFLVVLALAVWFGGFTFYAAVVIPTAHGVLGSHREVGFVTQQVTRWLNFIGLAALGILLWNAVRSGQTPGSAMRRQLGASLAVMVLAQVVLFVLHPILGALLDVEGGRVLRPAHFYLLHRVYLLTASVQWVATLLHLYSLLTAWRSADQHA